jgi:hypothetical protein
MDNAKAAKMLKDILSGKAKGWGAANPNFPDNSYVTPDYSLQSGNGPIGDPGFNRPISKKEQNKIKKAIIKGK